MKKGIIKKFLKSWFLITIMACLVNMSYEAWLNRDFYTNQTIGRYESIMVSVLTEGIASVPEEWKVIDLEGKKIEMFSKKENILLKGDYKDIENPLITVRKCMDFRLCGMICGGLLAFMVFILLIMYTFSKIRNRGSNSE